MTKIADFILEIQRIRKFSTVTEHSYRPPLAVFLGNLSDGIGAVNEPKRIKCGAPDLVVQIEKDQIPIGYVEAKDLDADLSKLKGKDKEQQERYRKALPNLIYTNCLDWDFYRDGELVESVKVAHLLEEGIQPISENYPMLETLLRDFVAQRPQTITSRRDLAERMAGKAQLIKNILHNAMNDEDDPESELLGQYDAFKENLLHDITLEDFADIYAETVAYGMFAARLHDTTPDTFSRQEALELLPKSNPFLRSLFGYIAGPNLDKRIAWVIDDLAQIFRACDVAKLMKSFDKSGNGQDPYIHFYETFLAAYNPAKRKARGVWYTPEPVVHFIVRAVDEVLETEFGLPDGLADDSKIMIDWDTGQKNTTKKGKIAKNGENSFEKRKVPRVQILDPATGTGTFLAEVIKRVAPKVKDGASGAWSQYIENELIPRLHGFELLMASYAMCHMKLDMILTELEYQPKEGSRRLSVYLTNSLEEGEPANQTLPFAQWLSCEAKGANAIKRDMPIMCVIGNPPYLGEGGISEGWLGDLMEDYKKEPGGEIDLKERNPKWLNDLYVKFMRISSHLIEKNGTGVIGFITNHGYLDNPTFRGMRWHLMKTFDKIYVLDLHGNANKKETTPEGGPDTNVFDIRQGVAIAICIKTTKKEDCQIFHRHLYGTRSYKQKILMETSKFGKGFSKIDAEAPYHMFYPVNSELLSAYTKGFCITDLMKINQKGIITSRDHLAIAMSQEELRKKLDLFCDPAKTDDEVRHIFWPSRKKGDLPPGDTNAWSVNEARNRLRKEGYINSFRKIHYRPFDQRIVAFSPSLIERPRTEFMRHFRAECDSNYGLMFNRGIEEIRPFTDVFVFNEITQHHSLSLKESNNIAPLYLYPAEHDFDQPPDVNMDQEIFEKIKKLAWCETNGAPDEIQVFDYVYGVLHCPAFRETFLEFLRIDFPRIPWPSSPAEFWDISKKGTQLRKLHLMEPTAIGDAPCPFVGEGDSVVEKVCFKGGNIWINGTQRFEKVPELSWNLYVGGYQPARKWLKDRKERKLSYGDVQHYRRILKILAETDRIMKTIHMSFET